MSRVPEPPGISFTPACDSQMTSSSVQLPDRRSEIVLLGFTSIKMFAFDNPKSVSKTATLNPLNDKLIAEFTASEVLPTPPFPLTKASDFTI